MATTRASVYHLTGPEIEVTYDRESGTLTLGGEDALLRREGLEAHETPDPEIGLVVTATVLESNRAGARYTLTLLLPDVVWDDAAESGEAEVTGAAVMARSLEHLVGGPGPVRHDYDDVKRLEGTVRRAG
jgi:hypothetical protein